jgi:hypothetical protein
MSIQEFHAKLISRGEGSRLFEAMRRLSRLSDLKFLDQDVFGWREWPPVDDSSGREWAAAGRI